MNTTPLSTSSFLALSSHSLPILSPFLASSAVHGGPTMGPALATLCHSALSLGTFGSLPEALSFTSFGHQALPLHGSPVWRRGRQEHGSELGCRESCAKREVRIKENIFSFLPDYLEKQHAQLSVAPREESVRC